MDNYMLPAGTQLHHGDYTVERALGAGGFGNTYVVHNNIFDETQAMKEFFMRGVNLRDGLQVTVSVPDNHASFEGQREKFRKEALRLRKLKNPHIVQVHNLFEENGTVYYVMDYIDGKSLSDELKHRGKPFKEDEVRALLPQILDALAEVHQQQIWHLDIKPGNIMTDRKGTAYLIDFGASKQLHGADGVSLSTSSALCYTPGYAPMEQVEQAMDKFGPWTDFYALGATLYTLLTNHQPPSLTGINEEGAFAYQQPVSRQMQDLIRWMMNLSRQKRPQSVAEIQAWLQGQKTQAETKTSEVEAQDVDVEVEVVESKPSADNPTRMSGSTTVRQQPATKERGFWSWLFGIDGLHKRNFITTFFMGLLLLVSIVMMVVGILSLPDNLAAVVNGYWSPYFYCGDVGDGDGLLIILFTLGFSAFLGLLMLLRWKRRAFWCMMLLQVMALFPTIGSNSQASIGFTVGAGIFDLLVYLLMLIPTRVEKNAPRRSAWSQCDKSAFPKWMALSAAALWLLALLFLPVIYAINGNIKNDFYEYGHYLIECDMGNYRNADMLADEYFGDGYYKLSYDEGPYPEAEDKWKTLRYLNYDIKFCKMKSRSDNYYNDEVERLERVRDIIENPDKYKTTAEPAANFPAGW